IRRLETPAAYAGTQDTDRRRSPWPAAVAVLLLVIAAIVVAALLLGNDDEEPAAADPTTTPATSATTESSSPTEPTTTQTTEDTTVQVDADDYIGRDYREVEDELSDLGLHVRLQPQDNDGSQEPDLVSQVDPSGTLQEGDTVTVHYWGSAPPPPPTTTETTPTETTTLPTEVTTSPAAGEGETG
ncbi:PASTA domain-containing protein, partial [Nocardioides sp.]